MLNYPHDPRFKVISFSETPRDKGSSQLCTVVPYHDRGSGWVGESRPSRLPGAPGRRCTHPPQHDACAHPSNSVLSCSRLLCARDLGHLCCSTLSCLQISGGGCLPPPTPKVRTNNQLGETLGAFFPPDGKSDYQKYSGFLSESLAWRSTTGIGYVVGKGAYVDPTKMVVPENPSEMGMVMRNGRRERINRPRATGDQLHFSTAQQLVNNAIDAHWATPSADRLKIN